MTSPRFSHPETIPDRNCENDQRGPVNAVLSFVGLGLLILVASLFSAVVYGLGLSN